MAPASALESRSFRSVLVNSLAASLTNNFVWFAVTFWAYLETQSVIVTSVMAGVYLTTVAVSGFFLGALVDRYPKKRVLIGSSLATGILFGLAWGVYALTPRSALGSAGSPALWAFIVLALAGALAGNLRGIALSTLVTVLVPPAERDRANGLVGTANGISFLGASVFSGLAVGYLGMYWTLALALVITGLVAAHAASLSIPERRAAGEGAPAEHPPAAEHQAVPVDLRGTLRAIQAVPGLLALILFHTFNNFLGGVFMSLMDAYGLELVSVQVWGTLWGVLSLGFIVGGLVVARRGLGASPLRTLFLANIVMWTICVTFTLQASIVLLTIGMGIYLCLIPVVEAAEQTILQRMVAPERQGRVFGFAQSVEQAASPLTAFVIGPIAQVIFIPFMTTGAGVDWLGPWFGTGTDRGLALLFTLTGLVGLAMTLWAMRSAAYRRLAVNYARDEARPVSETGEAGSMSEAAVTC
jgi:DHA3 family multidrug efflux protein-like MFS transporter